MFSPEDLEQIKKHGLDSDQALQQLKIFEKGFPFTEIVRPCKLGDGITSLTQKELQPLLEIYEKARAEGRISVFVPASGAATRMFKAPLALYHRDRQNPQKCFSGKISDLSGEEAEVYKTFSEIRNFAFWPELKKDLPASDALLAAGHYVPLLEKLLTDEGLGYGNLPKGLLLFHQYADGARTSFEEHVREAFLYAADSASKVRMHFTVSVEHEALFQKELEKIAGRLRAESKSPEISFSNQKPSTDTLAADLENKPFRDKDGKLVFRPAGHGALLENLQDFAPDIVFIKNIDNIQPDHRRAAVVETQKNLGGYLLAKQNRIFEALRKIQGRGAGEAFMKELRNFILSDFGVSCPEGLSRDEEERFCFDFLNRPIRVCGMVKNEGEPGGGPFWTRNVSGAVSRQVVEKSQVDVKNSAQCRLLEQSTHFNPVNLVCGVRDFQGKLFDLSRFVDPETGFISNKSKDGKELRALELPGLWNGAMAGWLTYFVETPPETFAPVKELNDLLRPEHQPRTGM